MSKVHGFIKYGLMVGLLFLLYNAHFDLLTIPGTIKGATVISTALLLLYAVERYRDRLARGLGESQEQGAQLKVALSERALSGMAFSERLKAVFLLFPALGCFVFTPERPWFGASIALFSAQGLYDAWWFKKHPNSELSIVKKGVLLRMKFPFLIPFRSLKRLDLKYDSLYFIQWDGEVTHFPLSYLPSERRSEVMGELIRTLEKEHVFVSAALKERFPLPA